LKESLIVFLKKNTLRRFMIIGWRYVKVVRSCNQKEIKTALFQALIRVALSAVVL
jgi:hypothetical protein